MKANRKPQFSSVSTLTIDLVICHKTGQYYFTVEGYLCHKFTLVNANAFCARSDLAELFKFTLSEASLKKSNGCN